MEKRVLAVAVAVAFLLGVFVGAVGGVETDFLGESRDSSAFESPGLSLTKSFESCDDLDSDSGWVHDVAVGESFAVTLEATVVHDSNHTVTANVGRESRGIYHVDLRTVSGDGTAPRTKADAAEEPAGGCTATHLTLGTSLPTDYSEFAVTMNGRTVRTVEYDGTTADLHRLPNPINATRS